MLPAIASPEMSPMRCWICVRCFQCKRLQDSSRSISPQILRQGCIYHSFFNLISILGIHVDDMLLQEMIFWNSTPPASSKFEQSTPYTQMPVLAFSLRAIWNATKATEEGILLLREFVPQLVRFWEWCVTCPLLPRISVYSFDIKMANQAV